MTIAHSSPSPRRLAWPRTSPFHGGNAGSNPAGDAKQNKRVPQNVWCFLPFRALANTCDWILLGPLPPDRMRIEGTHNVSDLRPAAPR